MTREECIKKGKKVLKDHKVNEPNVSLTIKRYEELAKKEQVLEIIVSKKVDMHILKCCITTHKNEWVIINYNKLHTNKCQLTQAEYDKIKSYLEGRK